MNYIGKEYEVYPKMDAYKAIKSLPMLQESTEYEKPDTGETTIIIINEAIWMGKKMEHTYFTMPQFLSKLKTTNLNWR